MKDKLSRKSAQDSEGLKDKVVDAPSDRFQTEQQINPTITSAKTGVASESYIPQKTKATGGTLKQEVASEVITGKSSGISTDSVTTPSAFGLKSISFSGDAGTILGSAAGTPIMDGSFQGKTRVDKRISDANKDINFNASEQVLVEYENIPPLANSDSTVGYNGNPKNSAARSQKKTGLTSAEMLFDRSIDYIEKDAFVYSCGQVVQQGNAEVGTIEAAAYPTLTAAVDEETGVVEYQPFSDGQVRGNYSPRELLVKVKKDSSGTYISHFEVLEDNISTNLETDVSANRSATNNRIDLNRAELARQTIDNDAGSPTSEHFNPLGRSVKQPTRTVTYLQDIENVMGATVFAAYKFAQKARGHYLNRTAKDGQDLTGPAIDALYGGLMPAVDRQSLIDNYDPQPNSPFFSYAGKRAGSAALLIELFDSIGKYTTKADIVNQPRGLKLHLQTADNNMDPFRVKKEFVAALNSVDAYSTIDRGYDPMAPVCILDNVRLVHPYSWAKALKFTREDAHTKVFGSEVFAYKYSAGSGQNSYLIKVGEPVLNGIAYFFDLHARKLYSALGGEGNDEVTLTIPIVHSTTHFSLWDFLVCAATPYIIYERTNSLKDILDYEMFYKYPFQGNVLIKDANPMNAVNYGNSSPYEPLSVGQMVPSSAIRWIWPELINKIGYTGDAMLPFYFNERSYDWVPSTGDDELIDNGSSTFTTPVLRSGVRLAYLDDFFAMEPKDLLLCLDRMTRIPGVDMSEKFNGYVYKYGQESDGIVCLRDSVARGITLRDWLSCPRMMGWFFDAPGGTCSPLRSNGEDNVTYARLLDANDTSVKIINLGTSFRAVQYKGRYSNVNELPNTILGPGSVAVDRGQSFTQYWAAKVAGGNGYGSAAFDLPLSLSEGIDMDALLNTFNFEDNMTLFTPFIKGKYATENSGGRRVAKNIESGNKLISFHRIMWPIVQKLPFIINPFDRGVQNVGTSVDPFCLAYIFGLAGFMAADYNEEDYNRINMVQDEGYGYTSDPFVAASPVFKDAYKCTEI